MYNSFTLCSTLFSTEGKEFFKGLVPPIVIVLFSRTKKVLFAFAISCKNKSV